MYVLVDHRDSFTHNLAQLFGALGVDLRVVDAPASAAAPVPLSAEVEALLLSPGPGHPESATGSLTWARAAVGRVPVLGVCLGHQILCAALGARVQLASSPVHGRPRRVHHEGAGLFATLPTPLMVARYHSWVVGDGDLPEELEVIGRDDEGQIMAVRHRTQLAYGLQFHPESFLTPDGRALAAAFVAEVRARRTAPAAEGLAHG